ncbi:hypothetical protein F4V57_03030 [Acinetobacter qingfengensis]|uniref:Tetratricopeptide repeat protein n=1 Tax=Acinetobacter qingfengensis TaxID=1262585 RepID=A0A1E7RE35_9GAMM|nr:hypothetical protein [Acinetobacter qingfengensis]KAA8734752.1 hypothetical protein F4V57_03030 [Acinetobacter qingfengensis]OEY97670.1 hypothetical protein BJI46_08640 [Acinetobacter qingfengensis]
MRNNKQNQFLNRYAFFLIMGTMLAGCQSLPPQTSGQIEQPKSEQKAEPEQKVKTAPYPDDGIRRESKPLPSIPVQQPSTQSPPRVILPAPKPQPKQQLKDGRGVAAYQKLMSDYLVNLRNNRLSAAENNLIQAQRIAPQSADVYRELARLANLRQQGANAEAMARKGLTFAQNNTQRKQLWQQILQSAQIRNNNALIQQAQQNINRY